MLAKYLGKKKKLDKEVEKNQSSYSREMNVVKLFFSSKPSSKSSLFDPLRLKEIRSYLILSHELFMNYLRLNTIS